jgi:hypothetical protein
MRDRPVMVNAYILAPGRPLAGAVQSLASAWRMRWAVE